MWTGHDTYKGLGGTAIRRQQQNRKLIQKAFDQELVSKIRHCANSGLMLGTEKFRAQVAKQLR
jgi:hypothetical protein